MSTVAIPQIRTGPYTIDDAIPLLQAKIAEKGGQDAFKVKIQRQASIAAPLNHIASFAQATIDHLANPETWLLALCGGGPLFVLTATHASEQLPTVTFRPPNLPGNPREPDPKVIGTPDWKGPPEITFPSERAPVVPSVASQVASLSALLGSSTPGSDPSARGQGSTPGGGAGHSTELQEVRHRLEMEAVQRAMDERSKATERQIAGLADSVKALAAALSARPPEPQESVMKNLPALLAAAAPIIAAFSARADGDARARGEADARRETREAEARGDVMKMFATMNERASSSAGDMMKMMTPMVESVSTMGRTVLQQVATMRELTAGDQQEPGIMDLVKAGIGAWGDFMAAKAAQPQQPRLPPARPPQGPQGQPPTQPPEQVDPEDAAQIEYLKGAPTDDLLKAIEDAIRAHHDAEEVVESLLDAMEFNAGVGNAIKTAGGVVPFFRARLTDEWIGNAEHLPYMQSVLSTLSTAAKARQQG